MKKIIAITLALVMLLSFAACSGQTDTKTKSDGKLSIVCTTFPSYDWTKNILGDRLSDVNLTLLLDNGVDLHNFQPSADDIITISTCDLFVYIGGESDKWVADTLETATNKDMQVINLLDSLGNDAKDEEELEGMEAEEEEEEGAKDEHIWLSVKNAEKLLEVIEASLEKIDSENASTYKANAQAYEDKLEALDEKFEKATDTDGEAVLLFGDRFPFRYLADDYDITCFAAFSGCSAETEASFETISFLAGKVDEYNLKTIITIEGSDGKIAETIKENAKNNDIQILSLNSMQSTTSKDVEGGASYLSIMESNLNVLTQAIG